MYTVCTGTDNVYILWDVCVCVCVCIVGVMFTQCDQRVVQLCTHNVYVLVQYSLPYTISPMPVPSKNHRGTLLWMGTLLQ